MPDWDWIQISAVALIALASFAGVVLTVLTLPGTWVTVAAGVVVKAWRPELMPWWVLLAALALALLAEGIEFAATALGAAKAGATRRGAVGAIIGSIVGALGGSIVPPFPLGTILGGVLGAGLGAMIAERHGNATWRQAGQAAGGAAAGRLVATLAKTTLAGVIAATLSTAAVVMAVRT
ncbi:MAG: hypothetical protein HBSAPP03_09510 [Phycisphaerae bacterium]|nr:MAG: hypothetical protein HBSAPP03_09510 [Phycisphaerae bacterium]